MQVLGMKHGQLTLTLTGDDCAILSHCLTAAADAGAFDRAGQETEAILCEAMATAFALGAVASASHGWVSLRNHDNLSEDLAAVGLGHLLAGDQDVLEQVARALGTD